MAVWRVEELHKGRKGGLRDGVERTYTRVFRVRTNSKADGPIEVMFAVDPTTGEAIPALYSSYVAFAGAEADLLALCRAIDPVQDNDDWTVWDVTCEYSTQSMRGDGAGQLSQGNSPGDPRSGSGGSSDPSLEPQEVEWSSWAREEVQTRELDGEERPIINSAFDMFDLAPMRTVTGDVLVVERNELTYNPYFNSSYRQHVNEDQFLWPDDQLQWLCEKITARQRYKGGLRYFRVYYEFHHCGDAHQDWDHHILDAGWCAFDNNGTKRPIMYGAGPPTVPQLLDGNGQTFTNDALEQGAVHYLHFRKYRRAAFGDLGIVLD